MCASVHLTTEDMQTIMLSLNGTTINTGVKAVEEDASSVNEYLRKFIEAISQYATKAQANYYPDRSPIFSPDTRNKQSSLEKFLENFVLMKTLFENVSTYALGGQKTIDANDIASRWDFIPFICSMNSFKMLFSPFNDVDDGVYDGLLQTISDANETLDESKEEIEESNCCKRISMIVTACDQFLLEVKEQQKTGDISILNLNDVIKSMFTLPCFTYMPELERIKNILTILISREETPSATSTSSNSQVLVAAEDRPQFNRGDALAVTFTASTIPTAVNNNGTNAALVARQLSYGASS